MPFTSPRSLGASLDLILVLVLVLVLGWPLALPRAGRAGRWAEGRACWVQPSAQAQLPGAARAACLPRRSPQSWGSVWTRPGVQGCPLGHTPLCPSDHGPCRRLYPGEDRASRWTWSPSCPQVPWDVAQTAPRLPLLRGGKAPAVPARHQPSWSRKCLISAVPLCPLRPDTLQAEEGVVPTSLCLWVLLSQRHLMRLKRRSPHPGFRAGPCSGGGSEASLLPGPRCPGGLGTREASRAWLAAVLRVPGPLHPRVHCKAPQRGRDTGPDVHGAQPGCRARPDGGPAWPPHPGSPGGDQRGPCTAGLPVSRSRRRCWGVAQGHAGRAPCGPRLCCRAGAQWAGRGGHRRGVPGACAAASARGVIALGTSLLPHPSTEDPHQAPAPQCTCQLPTCQVFAKTQTLQMCGPGSRMQGPALPSPRVAWGAAAAPRAPDGFAFFLCNQILNSFAGLCSAMAFSSVPPEKFVSFCINNKSVEMYFLK